MRNITVLLGDQEVKLLEVTRGDVLSIDDISTVSVDFVEFRPSSLYLRIVLSYFSLIKEVVFINKPKDIELKMKGGKILQASKVRTQKIALDCPGRKSIKPSITCFLIRDGSTIRVYIPQSQLNLSGLVHDFRI